LHFYQNFLIFQKIIKMTNNQKTPCCQIEAVVSLDERGQIIIPKDVRKKFNLASGDKFALMSCGDSDENGSPCCFTLIKTDQLKGMVQQVLGPMFAEIVDG